MEKGRMRLRCWLGLFLGVLVVLLDPVLSSKDRSPEVDISWDFDGGFMGWANATAEEMGIEFRVEDGEMRGSIQKENPHFDSPVMLLTTTRRHYVVFRMLYQGSSSQANLILKYGPTFSHDQHLDELKSNWQIRQSPTVLDSSDGIGTATFAVDDSRYTAWSTNIPRLGAWIILDLGDYRWITAIKLSTSDGDDAPRRCLLQQSVTSGAGPFVTIADFTLRKSNQYQEVTGFSTHSKYFKLLILDSYGSQNISVRDIILEGYDEGVTVMPFQIDNTGRFKNYYLPIHDILQGPIIRMRVQIIPKTRVVAHDADTALSRPRFREGIHVDYIRVVRSPEIWRVTGCLNKYFDNPNLFNPHYSVQTKVLRINGQLPIHYYNQLPMDLQYASTFDCPHSGDTVVRIEGINFGLHPRVYIDDSECPVLNVTARVTGGREQVISCRLPSSREYKDGTIIESKDRSVRVESGSLPGLFQSVPYFRYRTATPAPGRPIVTNIGARRVDIVWQPPGDEFDNLMTTGYKIIWFQPQFRSRVSNITVGNITTTSIRGLEPNTQYVFGITALAEGAASGAATYPTDLYGRRAALPGAIESPASVFTEIISTLQFDFDFRGFNANASLNSSGVPTPMSQGPTGQYGSEGNYGLSIVGSAQIENCNASMTCCDGFNATIGLASCGTGRSVCAVLLERRLPYQYVIDGVTRRQVPSNLPYESGAPPEKVVLTLQELIDNAGAEMPSMACGPSLRLTPSAARESGAVWYRRKANVREGFDTTITFQISNPSLRCNRLDDVNTYCRSRGADGIAFVIQNSSSVALGEAGAGLGYSGIFNSLAVELDTFYNYDQMDYYENHIAIMTQGRRFNITSNHSRSLATATRIPDLTDGKHTIRIRYDPNFDENAVPHPSFQTNGFTSWFVENADFANGGDGDWGTGFGLLYIYLDDLFAPIITTPLNLEKTLDLDEGRMFVGITAATGDAHWQAHDILSWQFTSLYIDRDYYPPVVVNGEGAHDCVNRTVCTNFPDLDHFMRKSSLWGKGYDSTEPWQNGKEGFCGSC